MVCVLLTKTAIMPKYVQIGSFENRKGVEKARQRHDEEEKVGWGRDLVKKLRRLGSTEGLPHSQSQHAMTAGIWHKSMCVNTEGVGHYDLSCVIACGVDTLYYRTNQDCLDPDQKHLIKGLITEFRQERTVNRNRVLVYYKARRYTLQYCGSPASSLDQWTSWGGSQLHALRESASRPEGPARDSSTTIWTSEQLHTLGQVNWLLGLGSFPSGRLVPNNQSYS